MCGEPDLGNILPKMRQNDVTVILAGSLIPSVMILIYSWVTYRQISRKV